MPTEITKTNISEIVERVFNSELTEKDLERMKEILLWIKNTNFIKNI